MQTAEIVGDGSSATSSLSTALANAQAQVDKAK
jgi:hypothetical protein